MAAGRGVTSDHIADACPEELVGTGARLESVGAIWSRDQNRVATVYFPRDLTPVLNHVGAVLRQAVSFSVPTLSVLSCANRDLHLSANRLPANSKG